MVCKDHAVDYTDHDVVCKDHATVLKIELIAIIFTSGALRVYCYIYQTIYSGFLFRTIAVSPKCLYLRVL